MVCLDLIIDEIEELRTEYLKNLGFKVCKDIAKEEITNNLRFKNLENSNIDIKQKINEAKSLVNKKGLYTAIRSSILIEKSSVMNPYKINKMEFIRSVKILDDLVNEFEKDNDVKLSNYISILRNVDEGIRLRYSPVNIRHSPYEPPKSSTDIQNETEIFQSDILNNLYVPDNKKSYSMKKIITDACQLHYQFVRIHPFNDGNGRSARLVSNAYLTKNKIFPVSISPGERFLYMGLVSDACGSHIEKPTSNLNILTSEENTLFCFLASKIGIAYENELTKLRKKLQK